MDKYIIHMHLFHTLFFNSTWLMALPCIHTLIFLSKLLFQITKLLVITFYTFSQLSLSKNTNSTDDLIFNFTEKENIKMHQLVNHTAFFEVYKMLALVSTFSSFLLAWKCWVYTLMSGSEPFPWISFCSLSSFTTFCLLNFPVICFVINILNRAALLLQKLNSLNPQLLHILFSSFFSPQS